MSWAVTAMRWRRVASLLLVTAAVSCDSTHALVRESQEPQLLLVLRAASSATDSVHTALLLTTGTPLAASYRDAQSFTMVRLDDGARLEWKSRHVDGPPPVDFGGGFFPEGGNYVLYDTQCAMQGTGPCVIAGATYSLDVHTGDRRITGTVAVPTPPIAQLIDEAGVRRIVWRRSRNAAMYFVRAETDAPSFGGQLDTTYTLRYDRGDPGGGEGMAQVVITAIDENFLRFLNDPALGASGITGAYGLLAGVAATTLDVPRSAPPTSP